MIKSGSDTITSLFVGKQGIKRVMAGLDVVYERPGSYVYITLDTSDTPTVGFIPANSAGLLTADGEPFFCKT